MVSKTLVGDRLGTVPNVGQCYLGNLDVGYNTIIEATYSPFKRII